MLGVSTRGRDANELCVAHIHEIYPRPRAYALTGMRHYIPETSRVVIVLYVRIQIYMSLTIQL